MKGIFREKFLKQFTLVWILMVIGLIITVNIVINFSFEKVKKNYVNENCALIGALSNNQAYKEEKMVAVLTQGAKNEDYEKGKKILASYGYKQDMDIKLIPKVNESYESLRLHINIVLIIAMLILYSIIVFFYKKVFVYVKRLNEGIKKVVEGDFSLRFSYVGEGIFNVLAHNFNQMAERLENALMELKKEKTFLKDTLANISHQLKTPITSMSLFNEALIDNPSMDKAEVEKIGSNMRSSLYRMEWLIKKLLKLAKIEGGAVEYNKTSSSLKETIKKALEPLLISIEEKNIKLSLMVGEGSYPHDKGWTSEALTNLVKNSIEHTKAEGEIFICYESNSVYHKISISDNGEGIDREDLPHIFERFYKGKGSGMKKTDSIGIGLALSKSIVEGQGGFVHVESEKGQGSKFTVTFLTNM